jgi:crossover junction endodeoxyribonuclease RuvC
MFVRVLGIDPGLTRCGYGLIAVQERRQVNFEANGVLTTSKENSITLRLKEMHFDLNELISELKPDVIAIEKVYFQSNVSSAISVAQVSGIVHSVASRYGIDVSEYTPTQIKNAITSDGKADKIQIQQMVVRMLNLKRIPEPADAADALAIALTHSLFINYQNSQDEKNSDEAIYNGSQLHNAIAKAITDQNLMRQKVVSNAVKKNVVRKERVTKKEGIAR